MKLTRCFVPVILLHLLTSCYSNKRMIYFHEGGFSEQKTSFIENNRPQYRIQPYDVLSVQIKSTTEDRLTGVFNVSSQPQAMFANPGNFFMEGYSVDARGKIMLPVIGDLCVKDLTIDETQTLVQHSANQYLNGATVVVKLTSFKVTVLGEVKTPGYYYVYNSQATLLEALGMAGDLTNFGNRTNIKLIRQKPAGSEVMLLDLTDPALLQSEYFFLMPGDVIYVEPMKARVKRANLELLGFVFSAATTAILILDYVNNE